MVHGCFLAIALRCLLSCRVIWYWFPAYRILSVIQLFKSTRNAAVVFLNSGHCHGPLSSHRFQNTGTCTDRCFSFFLALGVRMPAVVYIRWLTALWAGLACLLACLCDSEGEIVIRRKYTPQACCARTTSNMVPEMTIKKGFDGPANFLSMDLEIIVSIS